LVVRPNRSGWENVVKLKAVVHPADEGGFWVEIPALPGYVSQGGTIEETLPNVREAAEARLEVSQRDHMPDDTP
jgi:predicted RNase H-like HicB family nuclease